MSDPSHPSVLMVAMCVSLYVNASNFDATEIRSIVAVFLTAASGEAVLKLITRKKDKPE